MRRPVGRPALREIISWPSARAAGRLARSPTAARDRGNEVRQAIARVAVSGSSWESLARSGVTNCLIDPRAQKTAKRPIFGFLGDSTPLAESERAAAFGRRRLHDPGWIEGRTIAIENRWADGSLPPVCGTHLLSDSNYN